MNPFAITREPISQNMGKEWDHVKKARNKSKGHVTEAHHNPLCVQIGPDAVDKNGQI